MCVLCVETPLKSDNDKTTTTTRIEKQTYSLLFFFSTKFCFNFWGLVQWHLLANEEFSGSGYVCLFVCLRRIDDDDKAFGFCFFGDTFYVFFLRYVPCYCHTSHSSHDRILNLVFLSTISNECCFFPGYCFVACCFFSCQFA